MTPTEKTLWLAVFASVAANKPYRVDVRDAVRNAGDVVRLFRSIHTERYDANDTALLEAFGYDFGLNPYR